MFKKYCAYILIFILVFSINVLNVSSAPTANKDKMNNTADAYVLMDGATGQVLLEKASETQLSSANLAMNMAVLIFSEAMAKGEIREADSVTVSKNAWRATGTRVFLDEGEAYPAGDLLEAVVICSANDAAIALAEKLSINESEFVAKMNSRAKEIGLKNTEFNSITGNDEQKTTAYDMALLMKEISKHPQYFKWSGIWMDDFTHPSGRVTEMVNFNKMIRFYDGADGGKTGSSANSGFCLAATAKRGTDRFIYVCLGDISSTKRFDNAKTALDYAFNNFTTKTPVKKDKVVVRDIEVKDGSLTKIYGIASDSITLLLEKTDEGKIEKKFNILPGLSAPIAARQKIGEALVISNGNVIGKCDILSKAEVVKLSFNHSMNRIVKDWLS